MIRILCIVALGLSVAGCDRIGFKKKGPLFDGQTFRTSAKSAERRDRQSFVSTARPVSQSFDGAIEAATHRGVKHCIEYFGTSDIEWTVGPDTPREALQIEGDTLTFIGTCRDQG